MKQISTLELEGESSKTGDKEAPKKEEDKKEVSETQGVDEVDPEAKWNKENVICLLKHIFEDFLTWSKYLTTYPVFFIVFFFFATSWYFVII